MICFVKITYIFSVFDLFCKFFDKTTQPFLFVKPSKNHSKMSKSKLGSTTNRVGFTKTGFFCKNKITKTNH